MYGIVLSVAVVNALVVGVITWGIARRYGRRWGLAVPLIGLVPLAVMAWRAWGLEGYDTMAIGATLVLMVGPWVVGALLGLLVARHQDR
jgi:hypothetical protein